MSSRQKRCCCPAPVSEAPDRVTVVTGAPGRQHQHHRRERGGVGDDGPNDEAPLWAGSVWSAGAGLNGVKGL